MSSSLGEGLVSANRFGREHEAWRAPAALEPVGLGERTPHAVSVQPLDRGDRPPGGLGRERQKARHRLQDGFGGDQQVGDVQAE